MRRTLKSVCAILAVAAMAACGGGDEADIEEGAELAPPVDTTPMGPDTTMMMDTMMDTLMTTTGM